jgi:hypothetical protein
LGLVLRWWGADRPDWPVQPADPAGGIMEKHEVRCCRSCCGASCFDSCFADGRVMPLERP